MLDQDEREWRNRMAPTRGAAGRMVERGAGESGTTSLGGRTPSSADSEDGHACPVCAFASDDYDDVYVHLMTAHRKSTISAALLRP